MTLSLSAPDNIRFCSHCAAPMETRPVGDRPRRVCPACGFIHFTDPKVGVGVLIFQEGKILLVQRAMNPELGKWSIPAGFLDSGEDPKVTAVREILGETNLRVEITGLVDVYFNESVSEQGGASIFILYQAQLLSGQIKAGDDAQAAAFFGPDELPELAFSSTHDAIQRIYGDV